MINVADVREFGETGVYFVDPTFKKRDDFLYGSFLIREGNLFFQLEDSLADEFDFKDIVPKHIQNAFEVVREWTYGKKDPMALVRVLERAQNTKPLYVDPGKKWGRLRLHPFTLDAPVGFEADLSEYKGVIILSEGYKLMKDNRTITHYCSAVP